MTSRDLLSMALVLAATAFAAAGCLAADPASGSTHPRVMVLGTFHFEGSTSDLISVGMGDLLTPDRQAQIETVVERLARFAPTKILVELLPEHEADFNALYRAYRAGQRALAANECQQLGMRLAHRLGHDRLFAIDHRQDMDFDRVLAAGAAAGQTDRLARFQERMGEIQTVVSEAQGPGKTVLDALRWHNGDWGLAGNAPYLELAVLGSREDPAGAEVVGAWYERNLKIFANVARALDGPEERALVIIGSGHLAQLASFFDQSPEFEWVSALEVLGRAD